MEVQKRLYIQDAHVTLYKGAEERVPIQVPSDEEPYPESAIPAKMFTASTIRISNALRKRKAAVEAMTVGEKPKRGRPRKGEERRSEVGFSADKISRRIDDVIEEYEDKVGAGCAV